MLTVIFAACAWHTEGVERAVFGLVALFFLAHGCA